MEPKRRGRPPKLAESSRHRLTDHELQGLFSEAFEAFDMDDERVRFDTLNRRWVFVPVMRDRERELMLKLQVREMIAEELVSFADLKAGYGRPKIDTAVRSLDKAIA